MQLDNMCLYIHLLRDIWVAAAFGYSNSAALLMYKVFSFSCMCVGHACMHVCMHMYMRVGMCGG